MTPTGFIEESARKFPDKPAVIDGETVVSYAALAGTIGALAGQLQAVGVQPGSRVGLLCPNSALYIALTFALWRVEAAVVPIPMELTEEEIVGIVATLGLTAILSHQPRAQGVRLPHGCFFDRLPTAAAVAAVDNHGLNIAFIRFTSGTTSARKGVVLCHETVRDRIAAANKALRIGPEDTVVWCLPMAHHFLVTIVLYLSQGATIALAHNTLARSFLETTRRVRGTVLYASPWHYALLARDSSALDLPSVRLAVSTTCALTRDVAEDFANRFQRPLVQALGIIELGLVCVNLDDPVRRWDSVGKPLPDYRIRVLNPDDDGCGELAVSGPGFFDAYAQPWASRQQIMPDGWFHTGDIGRVDADGLVYLLGRRTAVINLGGRKVFPEEIEAVLNLHPAVKESRVFGLPHAHLGELIEAEVVLSRPETDGESLRDYCRAYLSAFKIPTEIHLVNAIPRTAVTGKIHRPAGARFNG